MAKPSFRSLLDPLALGALAIIAPGCGETASVSAVGTPVPVTSSVSNEGGFGPPAVAAGEFGTLPGTVMAGTAELAPNGCWYLMANGQSALLIFPEGTLLGDDGASLVLPDETMITGGSAIDITGGLVSLADLPGGSDGRWGTYVDFCDPPERWAAVATTVATGLDPESVDQAALAAELDASLFDTDYGCGFGFTTGDAGGRWALRVEVMTDPPPGPGPVTLPDDRFALSVTAGRHLFSNHCDDVMEWFEPSPVIATRWEVVAGDFTYPMTSGEICAGEPPATIVLTGAIVDTPAGPVPLDPIEVTNTGFGCFAG